MKEMSGYKYQALQLSIFWLFKKQFLNFHNLQTFNPKSTLGKQKKGMCKTLSHWQILST